MDQRAPHTRDAVLDKIVDICLAAGPVDQQTDKYFTNTSRIVAANGDMEVTYAVFMRRRVVAALEPTIRLIKRLAPGTLVKRFFEEGMAGLEELPRQGRPSVFSPRYRRRRKGPRL